LGPTCGTPNEPDDIIAAIDANFVREVLIGCAYGPMLVGVVGANRCAVLLNEVSASLDTPICHEAELVDENTFAANPMSRACR
jgi:hypothetical protein